MRVSLSSSSASSLPAPSGEAKEEALRFGAFFRKTAPKQKDLLKGFQQVFLFFKEGEGA
ncbi:hypothetical protein FHS90_002541 [Rufibacter quisquiliarum]|uniref:Uncharacterized protein n=1 Tax=Rufibacter quisquiliarum TaxID=1549639 RepID=A0A839GG15_9BACT|nr:hypothetical protein [Rufibacter quisquiliarum]